MLEGDHPTGSRALGGQLSVQDVPRMDLYDPKRLALPCQEDKPHTIYAPQVILMSAGGGGLLLAAAAVRRHTGELACRQLYEKDSDRDREVCMLPLPLSLPWLFAIFWYLEGRYQRWWCGGGRGIVLVCMADGDARGWLELTAKHAKRARAQPGSLGLSTVYRRRLPRRLRFRATSIQYVLSCLSISVSSRFE